MPSLDQIVSTSGADQWAVVERDCTDSDRILLLVAEQEPALALAAALRQRGTRASVVDLGDRPITTGP
jgi:hypothetical protein